MYGKARWSVARKKGKGEDGTAWGSPGIAWDTRCTRCGCHPECYHRPCSPHLSNLQANEKKSGREGTGRSCYVLLAMHTPQKHSPGSSIPVVLGQNQAWGVWEEYGRCGRGCPGPLMRGTSMKRVPPRRTTMIHPDHQLVLVVSLVLYSRRWVGVLSSLSPPSSSWWWSSSSLSLATPRHASSSGLGRFEDAPYRVMGSSSLRCFSPSLPSDGIDKSWPPPKQGNPPELRRGSIALGHCQWMDSTHIQTYHSTI